MLAEVSNGVRVTEHDMKPSHVRCRLFDHNNGIAKYTSTKEVVNPPLETEKVVMYSSAPGLGTQGFPDEGAVCTT